MCSGGSVLTFQWRSASARPALTTVGASEYAYASCPLSQTLKPFSTLRTRSACTLRTGGRPPRWPWPRPRRTRDFSRSLLARWLVVQPHNRAGRRACFLDGRRESQAQRLDMASRRGQSASKFVGASRCAASVRRGQSGRRAQDRHVPRVAPDSPRAWCSPNSNHAAL